MFEQNPDSIAAVPGVLRRSANGRRLMITSTTSAAIRYASMAVLWYASTTLAMSASCRPAAASSQLRPVQSRRRQDQMAKPDGDRLGPGLRLRLVERDEVFGR